MGKAGKAVAAGTAVASGPSGLRRLAGGGCLVVLLLLVGMAGCTAVLVSLGGGGGGGVGSGDGSGVDPSWPCPPDAVLIRYGPDGAGWVPQADKTATAEVLADVIERSGRAVEETDERNETLLVNWSGIEDEQGVNGGRDTIRLGSPPTRAWVQEALGERIEPCIDPDDATATAQPTGGAEPPAEPSAADGAEGDAQGPQAPAPSITWPQLKGTALVAVAVLAAWWIAGPPVVRALGWAAHKVQKTLARARGRGTTEEEQR